jgi:hypothetical protein
VGKIEKGRDDPSAFFLGGEASDKRVGARWHHERGALRVKCDGVRLSAIGFGLEYDILVEMRGIDEREGSRRRLFAQPLSCPEVDNATRAHSKP